MRDLLYRDEFCQEFGLSVKTAETWAHRGKGPKCFRIGRRVAYHRDDINAWLEAQRRKADARFGKKAA